MFKNILSVRPRERIGRDGAVAITDSFVADFTGDGKDDVLVYAVRDESWLMGVFEGTTFTWHPAGNTADSVASCAIEPESGSSRRC